MFRGLNPDYFRKEGLYPGTDSSKLSALRREKFHSGSLFSGRDLYAFLVMVYEFDSLGGA